MHSIRSIAKNNMIGCNPKQRVLIVMLWLVVSALACTSNDTLFIHLTDTPFPSATPTTLAVASRYHIGDRVTLVSPVLNVQLPNRPGSHDALDMSKSMCFQNTQVNILATAKSAVDPKDPTTYYQIQCAQGIGWIPEYRLTLLAKEQLVIVTSGKTEGTAIYEQPTVQSKVLAMCPDGTKLIIINFAVNPLQTIDNPDKNIFVDATCSSVAGYILAGALTPSEGQATATPRDF